MPKKFLPFHQPWFDKKEEDELIKTLRSGWITTGPRTKKFEDEFKKYIGAKHAIGVNSCTAALHLALIAAGVKEGDEVITTPITFASTANVIVHQNAKPVFVDVEPDTLNIDVAKIEEKITSKTRAIIPVDFAGHPCEIERIMEIAEEHNLVVIEDAAHAIGAEYRGKKIGSIAHMTAFSFYATKNITTGEGGMLTTDNEELAEKIRILSLHGISKDAWKRYSKEGYKHWDIIYPGYKYNMFDLQAALGLCQLKKIEKFWELRKKYVEMYDSAFNNFQNIVLLKQKSYVKHAYHLYVILLKSENMLADRDTIMNQIQKDGIGIGVHFRAIHLHPYYLKTFGFCRGLFSNAEYASDRVISLPLYPKMEEKDLAHVISTVKKIVERYNG